MTTAADIINLALKDAGVVGTGQTAAAEDANDALATLNEMIGQWNATKMRPPTADVPAFDTLASVSAMPAYYDAAFRYSLAELLAISYPDATGRADIARQAAKARKIVERKNTVIPELEIPVELLPGCFYYFGTE